MCLMVKHILSKIPISDTLRLRITSDSNNVWKSVTSKRVNSSKRLKISYFGGYPRIAILVSVLGHSVWYQSKMEVNLFLYVGTIQKKKTFLTLNVFCFSTKKKSKFVALGIHLQIRFFLCSANNAAENIFR